MNDGYGFRWLDLTSDEIERTSHLLRLVFPKARYLTPEYLEWQYALNPDGRAVGCNAYLGDALVAHLAALPMRARVEGRELGGILLVNCAVHPQHRGRKLQSRISDAMFEEAAGQGYAFCVAAGNSYSTGPLFTRFRVVAPLDARIGFGRPRRRERDHPPSFQRQWSEEAMRWRLANPERRYRVESTHGEMIVTAPSGIPGVGAMLFHGRDEWTLADRIGDPPGYGLLKVWIGLDPWTDWSHSVYLNIPRRLRPSPLNLMFKDLSGGALYPDPERLVFRAIDFDPY